MAISAAQVLEVRVTGSDQNSGGFKTGATGTDWSQQDAAQYSVTDGVTAGTTTITSAAANFGTDVVGNLIYVQGGTGSVTAGWYEITARTNSTTITVDRSTGLTAGTGVTLKIGGALASPGQAAAILVAGNTCWIKAGTYSITSASTNIAGGCLALAASSAGATIRVIGYQSARGDGGTKPVLQASGISTFTILSSGQSNDIENLELDGNNLTSSRGANGAGTFSRFYRCKFSNCKNAGIISNTASCWCISCEATGNSTAQGGFVSINCLYCYAHDNTITGFTLSVNNNVCIGCLSVSNTGATNDGFVITTTNSLFSCTSVSNGRDGFRFSAGSGETLANCLAVSNGGYGVNATAAIDGQLLCLNCATYNNTSGGINSTNIPAGMQIGCVALTGSPFVNAGGGDYSLNGTSGAGLACRGVGAPGAFAGLSTTVTYDDIGAVQHRDPPARGLLSRGISSLGRM